MFPGVDSTSMQSVGTTGQTYIVAQNPLVLAHLLRENQARPLDPQAYTTPASVFNTLSVDFKETPDLKEAENMLLNPEPNVSLQTSSLAVKDLQHLDPVAQNQTPVSPNLMPIGEDNSINVESITTISFPSDPNNSISSTSSGTLSRDPMGFSMEKDEILKVIIGHKEDAGNMSQNLTPQIQMTASLSSCSDFSIGNFSQISSLPSDSRRSSVNLDQSIASNNSAGVYSSKSGLVQQNLNQFAMAQQMQQQNVTQNTSDGNNSHSEGHDKTSTESVSQNSNQSGNPSSPRHFSNSSDNSSRVRSLERNTHIHNFVFSQSNSPESYGKRIGSLERNSKIMPGYCDSLGRKMSQGSVQKNLTQSHTGSLQRQFSVPGQVAAFQTHSSQQIPHPALLTQREMLNPNQLGKQRELLNPNQLGKQQQINMNYLGQSNLNASLAASVANTQKNRLLAEPPLIEEIYDFGGENVRSCASIAANKAGLNRSNQSGYFHQPNAVTQSYHTRPLQQGQYRTANPPNQQQPPNAQGSPRMMQPYMGVQGHLSRMNHVPNVKVPMSCYQMPPNIPHHSAGQSHPPPQHFSYVQTVAMQMSAKQDGNLLDSVAVGLKQTDHIIHSSASNISLGAQVLNVATPVPPTMAYQQRCKEVLGSQRLGLSSRQDSLIAPEDGNDLAVKTTVNEEVKLHEKRTNVYRRVYYIFCFP